MPVLFNAEVALLLNKQKKNYQEKGIRVPEYVSSLRVSASLRPVPRGLIVARNPPTCHNHTRTLTLTLEYCKRFANVKNLEDEGASQYLTNLRQ